MQLDQGKVVAQTNGRHVRRINLGANPRVTDPGVYALLRVLQLPACRIEQVIHP